MFHIGRVLLTLGLLAARLSGATQQELTDRLASGATDQASIASYIAKTPVAGDDLVFFGLMAARVGQDGAVRACLDAGLDANAHASDGETLLRAAIAGRASDQLIAQVIERGGDPKRKDDLGHDALFAAAAAGRTDLAIKLIDSGCDIHAGGLGCTAARLGELPVLERMVHDGIDPAAVDDGSTWLHAAAFSGRSDVVRWLLDQGADPTLTDAAGRTALEVAEQPVPQAYQRFEYPLDEGKQASAAMISAALVPRQ